MNKSFIGVASAITAAASTAAMMLLVNTAGSQFSFAEVLLYRSIFLSLVLLPITYKLLPLAVSKGASILWMRSVLGMVALVVMFYCLQITPIAQVSALFAVGPLFVLVLSRIFLKERLSRIQNIGFFIVVSGLFVMKAPGGASTPTFIVLLCLGGALARAGAFVSLRKATATFDSRLIVLFMAFFVAVASLIFSPDIPHLASNFFNIYLLGIALFSILAQIFLTLAYKYLKANIAVSLVQTEMIFAALFGAVFSGFAPTTVELVAYFLILVGGILVQPRGAVSEP